MLAELIRKTFGLLDRSKQAGITTSGCEPRAAFVSQSVIAGITSCKIAFSLPRTNKCASPEGPLSLRFQRMTEVKHVGLGGVIFTPLLAHAFEFVTDVFHYRLQKVIGAD